MKTQTAENNISRANRFAFDNSAEKVASWQESMVEYAELISKERIEALRERLVNEFSLSGQKIMINHIVNDFLKEINDGK